MTVRRPALPVTPDSFQHLAGRVSGPILKQIQDDAREAAVLTRSGASGAAALTSSVMLNSFQHLPGDADGCGRGGAAHHMDAVA